MKRERETGRHLRGLLLAMLLVVPAYADWDHPIKWDQSGCDLWGGYSTIDNDTPAAGTTADDFLCVESGWITEIEWGGFSGFGSQYIDGFRICFWGDAFDGINYHPGELLWCCEIMDPYDGFFGYQELPDDGWKVNLPVDCWFYQEAGEVYWISIQGIMVDDGYADYFYWYFRDQNTPSCGEDAAFESEYFEIDPWGHWGWQGPDDPEIYEGEFPDDWMSSADMCFVLHGVPSAVRKAFAGTTLAGMGEEAATILYDVPEPPPDWLIDAGLRAAREAVAAAGEATSQDDFALMPEGPGAEPPGAADPTVDRVSASEKGSLLVYPKIEIRWNASGELIQDTFVTINNDLHSGGGVDIQMYLVSESCTDRDNVFFLSHDEPAYWSAVTGNPKGVSPWTVLGAPYPDPDGSTDWVMRGYLLAWAVGVDGEQIRWNHLFGGATIVNYEQGEAWEYAAYSFPVVEDVPNGAAVGTPGIIQLDGNEYDSPFAKLLLDFFASGATAFSGANNLVTHDTDLTLLIVNHDFTDNGTGPYSTKAKFEIWNENEVGFSGMEYCVMKWDESLLSNRGGHFLVENLQTDKGRARIDGVQSYYCPDSAPQPLLGVAAKLLAYEQDLHNSD